MYREAILKTIAYADIFDFPLSYDEIRERLVEEALIGGNFDKALKELLQNGEISKLNGFYFLPYRADLPGKRQKSKFYSEEKLKKAKQIAKLLKIIPWIKLIGVTGAVAAENSKEKDDIDFFIITSESRLWITRFFVVLVLKLIGYYRKESEPNNKICPNIFLDETKIGWGEDSRNIYTANEVILLKPILDRDSTYSRFLNANRWCLDFLPNASIPEGVAEERAKKKGGWVVGNFIEKIFMGFQLWYMRNKRTSEVVTKNFIHFKRKDNKQWVLRKYADRLVHLNIKDKNPVPIGNRPNSLT